VLDTYRRERRTAETFIATFRRIGVEAFKQAANSVRQATEAELV